MIQRRRITKHTSLKMAAPNKLSIVKFLELALTITCLGLHYVSLQENKVETILLIAGTYVGYTIILVAIFAGYLMSTPVNKRLDLYFSLVGCCLFIASGSLVIDYWRQGYDTETRRKALAKGSLSIINGACFLVDLLLTFRE